MPMARRKLQGNGQTRRKKPRTSAEKLAAKQNARQNKAATRKRNRDYYRKNRTEILKRAKLKRKRSAAGDKRVTRTRTLHNGK